jgi:aminopeptidase YwaD
VNAKLLQKHLQTLLANGPRLIGSPANQAAANYIRDVFQSASMGVKEQPYSCIAWEHTRTSLKINGQPRTAQANAFSLACDVSGIVVPVSTLTELETKDIAGKILLFYGDLARQPVAPLAWFLCTDRDRQIINRLTAAPPSALLMPPALTLEYEQVTEDWALDVAAATIPQDTLIELLLKPDLQVDLQIVSRRYPETARNIVANKKKPGNKQKIVLCAHFDTKATTPGASDNAASVAILLYLAETLSKRDLPFDLEFIAFNGEEALPIGDDEYIRLLGDELDKILVLINLDGVGPYIGATSIAVFSASTEFEVQIQSLLTKFPGVVQVEPWPESNHSTFSFRGVPSLALSSSGSRHLAHTPLDRLEIISPQRMQEAADLVLDIVASLKVGSYRADDAG